MIDVDISEILDIKAERCNHVQNQGHVEPDQEKKYVGYLQREVVQASAKEWRMWSVTRCQF